MYLIGLYPLIKGNWTQELQYWSPLPIAPGSIIHAELRTKRIKGMVFKCLPIQEAKGEIKEAEFKTKKIESPQPIHVVRPEYIQAVLKASTYFVQNTGAMLKMTIPACAFDSEKKDESTQEPQDDSTLSTSSIEPHQTSETIATHAIDASAGAKQKTDIVALSTQTEDRQSTYKSIIREELARKASVLLITPTARSAEHTYHAIKKGIEHVTILLHGSLTKKQMQTSWDHARTSEKPIVCVTTPQFVSLPRQDIGTIIVEHEASRAYRTFHTPFFDWKQVIENYAKELRIKLVYGDQLLSFETIHRIRNHEIFEIFPLSYRIQYDTELIVVDMVEAKRKAGAYVLQSEELSSMIEYAHKKEQHMFIFSARRGLSPQTICNDCHSTVTCSLCGAPVVLHTSPKTKERYFLCHHCGKDRTALEACRRCNSWNLNTIGIGSDTVFDEIQKRYPHIPLFKIDKDSARTEKEALRIAKDFYATPGALLIGTETALSYIDKVKYTAIASMDNLFSIPDFRINERIAHICLKLFELTESYLLIQTRNAHTSIIKGCEARTLADFVKEELELREALGYAPYTLHGKISLIGTVSQVTEQAKHICSMLDGYDPITFPAMIPSKQGSAIHILFTLPQEEWRKEQRIHHPLYHILKTISAITPIHINPESFL